MVGETPGVDMSETDKITKLLHNLAKVCWDGCDLDGGTLQDWLEEAGVIVPTEVKKPCSDNCNCADYADFPTTCFRLAEQYK